MDKRYKIKLPVQIHRITEIYHTVGMWKIGSGKVSLQQAVYGIFLLAFVASSFIGIWTIAGSGNTIFLAALDLAGIIQVYRLYFIIFKQNRILDLMDTIGVHSTNDYQTYCNANNKINKFVKLVKTFLGVLIILCVAVVCLPLVKRLLFDIAFPMDYINEITFWIAYAFVVGTYFLSTTIFPFDITIWYLMLIYSVKYDLVASELRNLGVERKQVRFTEAEANLGVEGKESTSEESVRRITDAEISSWDDGTNIRARETSFVENFAESIKSLNCINGQLEDFESMFSNQFLFQIIASSVCICGAMFFWAFSTYDNFFQTSFFFIEMIYSFADIYPIMYLANEIMLSSDKLGYSLFESNWIDQTKSRKKCILIVVEYLKKPKLLTVGNVFPMNLETFIVIVTRAYIMFNVLRNFR